MANFDKLQSWLQKNDVDVAYINDPNSIAYFSGFDSDPEERILALLAFKNSEPFLFTPELEVGKAKNGSWPYDVFGYLDHEDPFELIAKQIDDKKVPIQNWAIDKDSFPLSRFELLKSFFTEAEFDTNLSPFVEHEKLIKSPEEIEIMIEAGKLADFAFETGFKAIKEGVPEQDIAGLIEYEWRKKGVKGPSFPTIVLGGIHGASPHGEPDATPLKKNELVLFDLGCIWKGYVSDATRTVAFGQPSDKALEIYAVCLKAQKAAQAFVKPGVKASEIDKVARDIITEAGYGEYFIHRLGHGLGTGVHEYPSIMEGNDLVIQEGMCFSIEPGIYIEGVAGVRIEDCGYVDANGFQPFTHTSKELTYIQ